MLLILAFQGCQETTPEPGPTNAGRLEKVPDASLKEPNGKGVSAALFFNDGDSCAIERTIYCWG